MTIRAPQELQNKLSKEAKKRGQTRNGLVLQILWGYFWREERNCMEKIISKFDENDD
jgi:hypothetical protein